MKNRNRRKVLAGSIGLVGAITTIPVWATNEVSSKYDTVVIGGGYSGLIAARNLTEAGYKALILEEEKSLNKRRNSNPTVEWFHPKQLHVASEISRFQLSLVRDSNAIHNADLNIALGELLNKIDGKCFTKCGFAVVDIFPELEITVESLNALTNYINKLSVILQRAVTPEDIFKFKTLVNNDVALLSQIFDHYKLKDDSQTLLNLLASTCGAEMLFSSSSTSLRVRGNEFMVCTPDGAYNTKSVVLAIPQQKVNKIMDKSSPIPEHLREGIIVAHSNNAVGWSGFIDGAIESGVRACKRLNGHLMPNKFPSSFT